MNETFLSTTETSLTRSLDNEVLTVMEVAQFLRVPKSTVYKLARLGQLPASKIGKHWRVLRHDLEVWVHSRASQGL